MDSSGNLALVDFLTLCLLLAFSLGIEDDSGYVGKEVTLHG